MPELDHAVLADYVRAEGGVAHLIGAGIDTIWAPDMPAGQNVGVYVRLRFSRQECGRPHRLEIIFQDVDGQRLADISGIVEPQWDEDLPPHWRANAALGVNIGIPLPAYGLYAFEILVNDSLVKTIQLRARPAQEQPS